MKTKNEKILKKNAAASCGSRKHVNLSALQQEMARWERYKTTPFQINVLLHMYLGMSEYLTPDGIYLMNQLAPLSRKFGFRQPQALLTLLCKSQSFTFICNSELTHCYGFYSSVTLESKELTRFESEQIEFCKIPINPNLTAIYNSLKLPEEKTEIGSNNEDKQLGIKHINFRNLQKRDQRLAKTAFNQISHFRSIYTNYILVNNIYISVNNNPPTEEARNAQLPQIDFSAQPENSSSAGSVATAAEKPTYGNADDYFHEMNQSEARRSLFFQPQRIAISRRYHLTLDESRFVLIHIVRDYLIPQFNQQSRFLTTPPAGRDRWLRNIARSKYYLCELDHAYQNSLAEIQAFRRQQARQQCDELRSNHPLSPHEWTSPKSGKRLYQDPVCGVIELPEEAAPRPTATARWNRFTRQWIESAVPS